MPRTLLWRTFLLISVLIVASVLTWFQIFRVSEREPRARLTAQTIASVVNLTRAALVNASPENRRALLADLADLEGIRVYPSEPGDTSVPPPDRPFFQLVGEQLRRDLGPDTRLAVERDGVRALWVSFTIEDDEYWVAMPRERLERQQALQWLWWAAAALLLALAGAYVVVSRVDRPLRELAAAAREIGRGRQPPPLPEKGPIEVETLARAFNQMSCDLARLDDDRTLILAGVSHDLRTPLARLRLGVEMSADDPHLKSGMVADIEDMDRIIGQFLDFARLDGGEAPEAVDVATLAEEVARHSRETGHALATEISPTPPLPLRRVPFRRVITNLLDNAFRYGGEDVSLRAGRAGNEVFVEVLDRGPGIPAEEVERLKQPFTRLETARSGQGGSGLGLAIVDRIVRAHGGRFDLLAREGGGLVARVALPLKAAH
ncbi:MAG: ATP-binding protein [Burkholderiales bacterium]|jgi:two-component system osmolarity sensor histidine kinase EnvZ|nr:ATP-binding protein [Burkholderiales bacterium]